MPLGSELRQREHGCADTWDDVAAGRLVGDRLVALVATAPGGPSPTSSRRARVLEVGCGAIGQALALGSWPLVRGDRVVQERRTRVNYAAFCAMALAA